MRFSEVLARCPELVKELSEGLSSGACSLEEVERRVLSLLNELGQAMEEAVVSAVREPTQENSVIVGKRLAVYSGRRNLRFRNRFGGEVVVARRCYKFLDAEGGGWNPVDELLGLDRCKGYSPLMSYLIALFGASEPFDHGAQLLSEAIGFSVGPTAVQSNTEAAGDRIPDSPYELIASQRAQESCDVMVVQVDGTISPQILEKLGLVGRESLKQPTDWKECNVVVIEKQRAGKEVDRWLGARYGKHEAFDTYAGRAALAMGQHAAAQVVFLADGAHCNWQLQQTNFPGSVGILDFYHASEHLGDFCRLFNDEQKAQRTHHRWADMLKEGQALQVIQEMRRTADTLHDRASAVKQINYFKGNLCRMDYDRYQAQGWPIGSGLVEGSCKFVVGKRFKGSGMRWKAKDNARVLKVRLEKLNGNLQTHFKPKPRPWIPASMAA